MKNFRNLTGFVVFSLLLGCQFPQTQPSSSGSPSSSPPPSSPSSPTSSPPSGQPPSGQPPSSSPSSPPPSGQPPSSSSDGETGSEGDPSSPPSSGGESESSDGSTMGEQMPLPAGAGGENVGEHLEDLDSQLDEALGDFDETMGESSGANSNGGGEQEIDILNPMTSGEASSENGEPLYDDGDLEESGAVENESIAQRAAQGADSGSQSSEQSGGQSGGQQGSASASEGGESGASAIEGQQAGSSSSGTITDGAGNVIPVPEDVGDGRNDDIVLRQIREAALQEKDPVLREKLWEEYRRIRDQK